MYLKSIGVYIFTLSLSAFTVMICSGFMYVSDRTGSGNAECLSLVLAADTESNPQADNAQGTVTFKADSAIVSLEKGKRGFKDVKGYRIQIFVGTADQMKTERNKFLGLGLGYSIYPKQIVPEYALQVGDFPTRMEMEKHLEIIKKHYPKAFPVVEVIEVPKFGK